MTTMTMKEMIKTHRLNQMWDQDIEEKVILIKPGYNNSLPHKINKSNRMLKSKESTRMTMTVKMKTNNNSNREIEEHKAAGNSTKEDRDKEVLRQSKRICRDRSRCRKSNSNNNGVGNRKVKRMTMKNPRERLIPK